MKNAKKLITAGDRERIASLEEGTGAEVVCAVATESARYDRAESICGLLFGLLALAFGTQFVPEQEWGMTAGPGLVWQVALIVAGFVAGSLFSSYWHPLRRLLVPNCSKSPSQPMSSERCGNPGHQHHGCNLLTD
jgi:uncharacterized membrane protein